MNKFSLTLLEKLYDKKTPEEIHTINAAFFSIFLLESGIIYDCLKSRYHHYLTYIILFIITIAISIILLLMPIIYEYILLKKSELITYIVREGDSLLTIAAICMPGCNPWRTAKLIRKVNNINSFIYIGEQILVPLKH